jgi:hypothetical protein
MNILQNNEKFVRAEMKVRLQKESVRRLHQGLTQQAEVAQGVPVRLRPRIFLTFGTTRMVGCQPYIPAVSTPGEITGTHF